MEGKEQAAVLQNIDTLFSVGVPGVLADGQLLERVLAPGAESAAAFKILVERHAPMVWGVCCRVLTDRHDAQDAFQATFLILARQARLIRNRDSVASWLYGVALRAARNARSAQARRRKHERRYGERQPGYVEPATHIDGELPQILDEELSRLPERLRAAIVLCDMEDLTHEQAAAQLGWPVGTVKSRLARGRQRLRLRLVRRGLAPSLALAAAQTAMTAGAAVPPVFVAMTIETALRFSASRFAAEAIPAALGPLIKREANAVWIKTLKWLAAATLAIGGVALAVGVTWSSSPAQQAAQPAAKVETRLAERTGEDALWARHSLNLKRIGLAMVNYQSAEGHYPPAAIMSKDGKPLLSWRVAILPYLEGFEALYKEFRLDEAWDSPHNMALLVRMPSVFSSRADHIATPTTTPYRVFVGSKESQQEARLMTGVEPGGMIPFEAGTMFRVHRGTELREITDGTNNTILVVEAAQAVPWTKPEELSYAVDRPLPPLGGSMRQGFAALFASGLVRFLDISFDERTIRALATRNGGEIVAADRLPSPSDPPPEGFPLGKADKLATPSPGFPQRYAGAKTLGNALGILKDQLRHDDQRVFAGLLTDSRARQTIRAGLSNYENYLRRSGEPQAQRDQFEIVKPALEQIALQGSWPADCWFTTTDRLEAREEITYDHLQVNLNIESLDHGKPFTFTVLMLDVFSGPVESAPTPGPTPTPRPG
jgi:RNA polymerase sigma factor (sigma-70 family)